MFIKILTEIPNQLFTSKSDIWLVLRAFQALVHPQTNPAAVAAGFFDDILMGKREHRG